jgi:hypothetical protein
MWSHASEIINFTLLGALSFNDSLNLHFLENCAPLGYDAASSGNSLPTFLDNLSLLSSKVKDSYSSNLCSKVKRKQLTYDNQYKISFI